MSYKLLDHATDAVIEITASNLKEAFVVAGQSVVDITLDSEKVEEKEQKVLKVIGKDLRYLLFNWLEEVNYQLITEGFAIHRFALDISKNSEYNLNATAYGEPLDLQKHHFRVEIKAPTFHEMEIKEEKQVVMRFLLDL
ncbi:MAG TPA: archease [Nitrosopumilaceae archaeon]|nr:archease [Nitrosopumilaceae archaeon]